MLVTPNLTIADSKSEASLKLNIGSGAVSVLFLVVRKMASQVTTPAASEPAGSRDEEYSGDDGRDIVAAVLRILADTQRMMLDRGASERKNYKALANIKLEDVAGGKSGTTHQCREWKKDVRIKKKLNDITDQQLALLIYTQVTGKAKALLTVLSEEDVDAEDSLVLVWQIFDKAHEKTEDVRADVGYSTWDNAVRNHG